jgi:hypothetical protein
MYPLIDEHREAYMTHRVSNTARSLLSLAAMGGLMGGASLVNAQSADAGTGAAVAAQQAYNAEIASCNNAGYPAPQRESCVRDAGLRLDRFRGAPAVPEPEATADGRAIVMTPSTASSSLRGSTTTTTSDGRATVVVPALQAKP